MPLKAAVPTGQFAFRNTICKAKLNWPGTSGSPFNAAYDPQGSKRHILTHPFADSSRQGERVGLLWALSLQGFTFLGVPAFMPLLAHGAAQLLKFPISTKPLVQDSGMAGTLLDWG